jgi:hypothetical protein
MMMMMWMNRDNNDSNLTLIESIMIIIIVRTVCYLIMMSISKYHSTSITYKVSSISTV